MNQEIKQYLQLFILYCQHNWPEWVTIAEFSYNNKIHASIKVSPFFTNYCFNPRMGVEPHRQTKVEAVDNFTKWMKFIHEEAQVTLTKAKEEMKCYADYHHGDPPQYQSGQKVLLEAESLVSIRLHWSWSHKLTEPRCILQDWKGYNKGGVTGISGYTRISKVQYIMGAGQSLYRE